jgi:Zn finger protein HypA/HybF involved in hydrogenase expression
MAWLKDIIRRGPELFHLRFLPYFLILGIVLFFAFGGGVLAWEYTNGVQFCGTTCHTMPPEYTAYQVSPHARVLCVDCHLGQESTLTMVPRKAMEIRHVIFGLTQAYETPIHVKSLRPARDTCEKCHWPEKFASDKVLQKKHFNLDEQNTETDTFLSLKTGGGTAREGLGKGIHWHIENEVWYIPTDTLKQEIPYVKQIGADGKVTEYFDTEANLPADFAEQNKDKLRRMDCIDCHNRISHLFRSPERALDLALERRQIDRTIPSIKAWGSGALNARYASQEEALAAIDRLEQAYQEKYPEYYANNQQAIRDAIGVLKEIYQQTVFPDMDVGWETHPDNIGHGEFPGCFRCHDGKHLSAQNQAIRLECNLCHSIPQQTVAGRGMPVVQLASGPEPASHLSSNWIAQHRFSFDETCSVCHDTADAGGKSNTSFCSNSACHGLEWKYAGLNAPAIVSLSQQPAPQEQQPAELATPSSPPPRIPHAVAGFVACQYCHSTGREGAPVNPANHAGYTNDVCLTCHKVK